MLLLDASGFSKLRKVRLPGGGSRYLGAGAEAAASGGMGTEREQGEARWRKSNVCLFWFFFVDLWFVLFCCFCFWYYDPLVFPCFVFSISTFCCSMFFVFW